MIDLTYEQFKDGTKAPEAFADRYWPYAQKYLPEYGILENEMRVSAFLATISVESNRLQDTEEGLYYKDPLRLAMIFKRAFDEDHDGKISQQEIEHAKPFCRNPDALSQVLYNGFPGRGLIQLTWEKNYRLYAQHSGVDVITYPKLLREPEDAFRSACWFWQSTGCNEAADTGDMKAVTRIVNGKALMHLAERTALYDENMETLFA